MRSTLVFVCCLALASAVGAEENKPGKKRRGPQAGQQAQGPVRPAKIGKAGKQQLGPKHATINQGTLPAVQGNKQFKQKQTHQDIKIGNRSQLKGNKLAAAGGRPAVNHAGKAQIKQFKFANANKQNIQKVTFNKNYKIVNAQNWHGAHYAAFRNYSPIWHDRGWWHHHHNRIVFVFGGWYYWNAGWWYPAWGYDPGSYYVYDGPIYAYNDLPPDQVTANVQASLQEQGYYQGEVDGLLGPLTRAALADYQRDHGLYTTAAIDEPTLASLGFS